VLNHHRYNGFKRTGKILPRQSIKRASDCGRGIIGRNDHTDRHDLFFNSLSSNSRWRFLGPWHRCGLILLAQKHRQQKLKKTNPHNRRRKIKLLGIFKNSKNARRILLRFL